MTIGFGVVSGQLRIKDNDTVYHIDGIDAFDALPIDQIAKESIRDIVEDWFND